MGFLTRFAKEAGMAIGTFQRSLTRARHGHRPGFLSSMAEAGKWRGGDYTGQAEQAQRRALQNGWLFAGLRYIANEFVGASFEMVEWEYIDEEPVAVPNHPFEQVLRRPNPWMGRAFLWFFTVYWLKLSGNAYWFLSCDDYGRIVELWPLPACDTEPTPGDAERFVDYYEYTANGKRYQIPAEYVVHFQQPNPFDIFRGLSDLVPGMLPVDSDLAMARWNGTFFGRDNVMPSAIINLSSGDPNIPIDPSDSEALKQDLRTEYAAFRRKTAVTTANKLEAVLLSWNAKDMDFFNGRKTTKEEIWSIIGIHAGIFDPNSTEANATVAERVTKNNVWGLMTLVAEQITAQVAIPFYGEQYEARFEDIRPVNRLLELQEVSVAGPYLTRNEIRQKYWGMDPLDGDEWDEPALSPSPAFEPRLPDFGLPSPNPSEQTGQNAALQAGIRADLKRWERKALKALRRSGEPAATFKSDLIPPAMARQISDGLGQARAAEEVKAVFQHAQVKASPRPWDAILADLRVDLATTSREEAERFAGQVEQAGEEILDDEQIWLHYKQAISSTILSHFQRLAEVGSEQALSQTEVPRANWNLVNQNAATWARQHAAQAVEQITETTRQRIRDELAAWIEAGTPKDDLVARIDKIINNPARAEAIAVTEATNVYAAANDQAWSAAGVPPAAFRPAAHVRCRCYLQPYRLPDKTWVQVWYTGRDDLVCETPIKTPWGEVEGCKALHMVIISEGPYLGRKLKDVITEVGNG